MIGFALADPTEVLGVNRWIKPMKFFVSISVFMWTIGIYLYQLRGWERFSGRISLGLSAVFVIEMAAIVGQAARGTTSHFNIGNAFDGAVFAIMGVAIAASTLMTASILYPYFKSATGLSAKLVERLGANVRQHVRQALALGGQHQLHLAAIQLGPLAAEQVFLLQPVEHARHRAGIDAGALAEFAGGLDLGAGQVQQRDPLRAGDVVRRHLGVDRRRDPALGLTEQVTDALGRRVVLGGVQQRVGCWIRPWIGHGGVLGGRYRHGSVI